MEKPGVDIAELVVQAGLVGPDTNIKFIGNTRDGRPIYEFIDKHTGKKTRKIISKKTYAAMNLIIRKYGMTLEKLAKE